MGGMAKKEVFAGGDVPSSLAQALANSKEARELLQRWVPENLREQPRPMPAEAAGKIFWRVVGDLAGHSRRLGKRGR